MGLIGNLTLLHSERPNLYGGLAVLSAHAEPIPYPKTQRVVGWVWVGGGQKYKNK